MPMNRVVIITGASSGLGLSLAKRFLAGGDTVVGTSRKRRNWRKLLDGRVEGFLPFKVDVTSQKQVARFLASVCKRLRRVDVVINNAGYGGRLKRIEEVTLREFQKHLDSNLISAFLVCKGLIPVFREQRKGLIINISSYAGKRALPRLAAYCASKFGMVALSQTIARETQDTPIKCVTVCPGGINTKMRVEMFGTEDAAKQQSPDFVADMIYQVSMDQIPVESGGDLVIRYGKVVAVNPAPVG